jgi:predicted nucleic acid-binding protein
MADKAFVDTNIICYLFSEDTHKAGIAEMLLNKSPHISVQVLNETANVLRRKLDMPWAEVSDVLQTIRILCKTHPLTLSIHTRGLALVEKYSVSLYDAMILAAALEHNCTTLFTEDMQHNQIIDGTLVLINPFK